MLTQHFFSEWLLTRPGSLIPAYAINGMISWLFLGRRPEKNYLPALSLETNCAKIPLLVDYSPMQSGCRFSNNDNEASPTRTHRPGRGGHYQRKSDSRPG